MKFTQHLKRTTKASGVPEKVTNRTLLQEIALFLSRNPFN